MKKTLLSLFVGSLAFASTAQNNQLQPVNKSFKFDKYERSVSSTAKGTVTCDNDTVDYTLAKATGLAGVNLNNATSVSAICQYFTAPQSIDVHGASFYAYKIDATGGTTIDVTVEVYLAGTDSMPTGSALATTTVTVDTTFGGGALSVLEKTANFSSAATVTQPYVIVVTNNSPNGVGFVNNSYTAGDGAQEWLSSANLFGTWTRSYNLSLGGNPFDADALILPFVSYDLTVSFNVVGCLPATGGGTIDFTNSSSPILNDPMYSYAAFIGNTDTSYIYNFGDDTTLTYMENPSHLYAASGTYTVTLGAGISGWRTFCGDQTTGTVDICTGINDIDNSSVNAYPNPVRNNLYLNGLDKNSTINLYDVSGKLVLTTKNLNSGNVAVSMDDLNTGIYFVKVVSELNNIKTLKVIKE